MAADKYLQASAARSSRSRIAKIVLCSRASQGLTVDETFVLHDAQMDRASAYVSGSRHRDACHWFCNSKVLDALHPATNDNERLEHLAKSLSVDRYHELALTYWEKLPKESEPEIERSSELELA